MKQLIYIFLAIILSISCDNSSEEKALDATPTSLENDLSYKMSKRNYEDLIESLYNELVNKIPELKKFENNFRNFRESKRDSFAAYEKYNEKNTSFYNSADEKIEEMKDSLLKQQMKTMISKSLSNYNSMIAPHTALLAQINEKEIKLNDLHTILKLSLTLPLLERFQINRPSLKPLQDYSNEASRVKHQLENLIK